MNDSKPDQSADGTSVHVTAPVLKIKQRTWQQAPFRQSDYWITTPEQATVPWPDNLEDQLLWLMRETIKHPADTICKLQERDMGVWIEFVYQTSHLVSARTPRIWKKVSWK